MELKVRPVLDRVLIKQDAAEETMGVLFIPDKAKEKPRRGEVVAVGPGARTPDGGRIVPVVQVGDKVIYGEYSGHEIDVDGESYIIVEENKILIIL